MGIIEKITNGGLRKETLFDESKTRYTMSAMIAGAFIGFGTLIMAVSNMIFANVDFPIVKFVNGFVFSLALSLVMVCGAELFTGNILFFGTATAKKKISLAKGAKICALSYIGNFLGALALSALFLGADTLHSPVVESVVKLAMVKVSYTPMQMFFKGILCNVLVCLGVYAWNKLDNESAKLITVVWVILPFVAMGFEHSVANMTCFIIAKIASPDFTFGLMLYNLVPVTIGNIIGGLLVALPYYYIEKN